jgi:aryl-alcohol dehydrogenase-like predicted oxidoreductase
MRNTALGDTGLIVTPIGLGLAAVGRPAYITLGRATALGEDRSPEDMRTRTHGLLGAATRSGIGYVDVARSYGRAEEFLAEWLRAQSPTSMTIGSKWGYEYTAGWQMDADVHEQKEHTLERFTRQLAESRRLLGDRLSIYQIHSATLESGCLDDAPLLDALVAERHAGSYAAIGLTLTGPGSPDALDRALSLRLGGERVFDVVQATFNPLEPSIAPCLERAHDAGLGVIVKEAFANGRLTPANDLPADAALRACLEKIASHYAAPIDHLAVAFVLAHPFVDVVLSGAATPAQLTSHLAATSLVLDPDDRRALADLAEAPARYWSTRAELPWQ